MASANGPNGRSTFPNPNAPTWDAAALLAPRSRLAAPPPLRQPPRPATNGLDSNNSLVFQFTGPSDVSAGTDSPIHRSANSTPVQDGRSSPYGMGAMIERMTGIQDRSSVPQVKRRKFDTPEAEMEHKTVVGGGGGGSGMLGEYVAEKREEGKKDYLAVNSQTVDLTEASDDLVMIQDPANEEVCYGMIKAHLQCHTVPSVKPGTQSIFGPGWVPQVKIVLKRIVGDPTKTIQAYDFTRQIIGNVDSMTAKAVVPLLDSNIGIRTDCRVPSRPKAPGEEPGQPISKAFNLEITLYGTVKYARPVGKHLYQAHIPLVHPNRVDKGIRYLNPHTEAKPFPIVRSNAIAASNYATQSSYSSNSVRTVEEIRSDVMGVFDSIGKTDELPELEPDHRILTPLLKHQKQGLYFMTMKEKPHAQQPSEISGLSFWQARIGPQGQRLYHNVVTGNSERHFPPEAPGGVLADMMGLGKTLSILSLVSGSQQEAQDWANRPPIQPEAPPQKPSKNPTASSNSLALTPLNRNAKTTLLVCPLSTVTNWEEQMKQHIAPGTLSYYIYHGSNRIKDVSKLAEFDLVMTTYGSVSSELGARSKRKAGKFPLEEIGWFRIVLDEAHMIREVSTLQFKAIVRLQAARRWAVTGTPVQNRLEDFAALLAFLRVKPFDDRNKFNRYIVDPFKACDPEIVPKLRVLVDSITLRRLKDKIDLPPRSDQIVKLNFTPEERQIYDLFEKNAQDRVQVLAGNGVEKALGGHTYMHILRSILRLRLLCAHGKDLLSQDDLQVLQGMTADMAIDIDSDDESNKPGLSERRAYEMFELMQDTNHDTCISCTKKLGSNDAANIESEGQEDILGYMTPCFHIVCSSCIRAFKDLAKANLFPGQQVGNCPICAQTVHFSFVALRRTRADVEHDGPAKARVVVKGGKKNLDNYEGPHTKTRALVEDLLNSKAESLANPSEPPFKSVVFTGWTSHIDLIEKALDQAGIIYVRLDGSMSRQARTTAMDRFREDPIVHVILVSIMAGGLGLNLTAGNNVYVMEPQYNPAAEAQAVDRVHRLGQKRPVRTIRYIMANSFEEKMLDLQDKKRKLASLSMDGKDRVLEKGEAARQKLMDLRSLFK